MTRRITDGIELSQDGYDEIRRVHREEIADRGIFTVFAEGA